MASILVFLCFGVTQAKDGPFTRPHPGRMRTFDYKYFVPQTSIKPTHRIYTQWTYPSGGPLLHVILSLPLMSVYELSSVQKQDRNAGQISHEVSVSVTICSAVLNHVKNKSNDVFCSGVIDRNFTVFTAWYYWEKARLLRLTF